MRCLPALIMLAAIVAVSQYAAPESAGSQYRECSDLASRDPAKALVQSHAWRQKDPESPVAGHCEAIALYAARDYAHSALMLEALTHNASLRNSPLTAELAVQTAVAENADGHDERALAILSSTILHGGAAMDTDDRILLLSERAKLYRAMGKPLLAVQDLDFALTLQPENSMLKTLLADTSKKTKGNPPTLPER